MTEKLIALAWDTNFLGYPVGRITLQQNHSALLPELVEHARASHFRLLYIVVQPQDQAGQEVARQLGATLVDRKVTYLQEVVADLKQEADTKIVEAHQMSPNLRSLALQSGEYSRFRCDPKFAPQVYESLYTTWMENSISGQLAQSVLVYCHENAELGVITIGAKNGRADIGLLAVDARARGARIGQRLILMAKQKAQEWGFKELQVVTQLDNEPACHFYERCGFKQSQLEYIFHLWLS